jgi:hypothetical protein
MTMSFWLDDLGNIFAPATIIFTDWDEYFLFNELTPETQAASFSANTNPQSGTEVGWTEESDNLEEQNYASVMALLVYDTNEVQAESSVFVEAFGNTKLLQDERGKYLVQVGSTPPITIRYKNRPVYDDTVPGWQLIAAEIVNGKNQILLKNVTAQSLQVWNMDSRWRWTSSEASISWNSTQAFNLESVFSTDANGDGVVGVPTTAAFAIVAKDASQTEGNQGSKAFTFTVNRTGNLEGSYTLQWSIVGDGSNAAAANDFVGNIFPTGSLSFAAGETTKIITVNVNGDSIVEADEDFSIVLNNVNNGGTITTAKATGKIINDDFASGNATIGTNLYGVVDWSTAFPFIDAFKSSRPFTLSNLDGTDGWYLAPPDVDANGWVRSIPVDKQVNTAIYTANIPGYSYPWREFIVLYEGEGTISYSFDAVKNESASTLGRDVIDVNPQNGIVLSITATNPENYLRNIRVIPTEWEETYSTQLFNPDYLAKLEPFSAFRFMDQMATNNSTQKDWADRPTVQDASWQSKGAPVEIMVQFANETGSDPWFTMPHQATDDYVRSFATYVRDNLDPNLDVYIEYSNEVWNGSFQQYYWVLEQAKAAWPTSTEGDFTKVIDWYSLRTTQVTRIWDEVFGADKGRVIGVMAGMAASSWVLDRALDYAWTTSPLSNQQYGIDVLSIAPYFGYQVGSLENETTLNNWTQESDGGLNKLFQELETGGLLPVSPTGGALNEVNSWISSHAALAEAEGLGLTAYEAGQHLAVHPAMYGNAAIVNLFSQANRDPRMGEIYDRYLQMWSDLGGGLMMNYTDIGATSMYGSWGSLEHLYQDSSPKWDALTGFLA